MNIKDKFDLYSVEIDRTTNWRILVEWWEEGAINWDDLKSIVVSMIKHRLDEQADHIEANRKIAQIILANDREGADKWAKNLMLNSQGVVRPMEPEPVGWLYPGGEQVRGFVFGPKKPDERTEWVPVYESAFVKGVISKPLTEEIGYVLNCNRGLYGKWPMSIKFCRQIIEDFLHIRNNPIGE